MPLYFPSSPTVGQQSTQNGRTYQWTGFAWELVVLVGTTTATTNASLLTTGTLSDARLSANVVLTGDSRLSNARTPTAHKTSHAAGGADALTAADIGAATSSHIHAAADVTSGTFAIGRIPTGTTSSTVCIGDDARLSNSRAPTSHTHGNITNAGAIGSTANLPVITTTSGVLTTGTFGTAANSFCQGNDSRLSDARTPTAHNQAASTISDSTAAGRALLTAADAAAQRTALALGTMATQSSTAYLAVAGGTMTGQIAAIAGTASAPGVGISGDTNTGIAQVGGADTIGLVAGGQECFRVNGSGNIAAVVEGNGAPLYPGYVCRAWINFQGTANSNITGTYSQSGTTVTITTSVAHGLSAGQRVVLDFTSGGNTTDQSQTVATVTSTTVFTVTASNSLTANGNVTIVRATIRGSGNVTSVADKATGDYFVNFFVPCPHTNYAVLASCTHHAGSSYIVSPTIEGRTQHSLDILTSTAAGSGGLFNPDTVCVAVFY